MYELSIALSYLLPRRKQISTSVVGMLSVLVVLATTWLILVFFSTTEGIESRWSQKISGTLGALRVVPSQTYFSSPSSRIDCFLPESHCAPQRLSVLWKKKSIQPSDTARMPADLFAWYAEHKGDEYPIRKLTQALDAKKISWSFFESSIGHLTITCSGQPGKNIHQYSSVLGFDSLDRSFPLLSEISAQEVERGVAFLSSTDPKDVVLGRRLLDAVDTVEIFFNKQLLLGNEIILAHSRHSVQLKLDGNILIVCIPTTGGIREIPYSNELGCSLIAAKAKKPPLLLSEDFRLKSVKSLGYPVLLPKFARQQGVLLGDSCAFHISDMGDKNIEIPGYVAGFFDPGILPIGGKLVVTARQAVVSMQPELSSDSLLGGSGLIIHGEKGNAVQLQRNVDECIQHVAANEFTVQRYDQYDLTKELYQQLMSERTLFRMLSVIIIIVACSNIFSMLFILAHDRRKEIAILRALGASVWNVTAIFLLVGAFLGLLGAGMGALLASVTLQYLPEILQFLGSIQGHEVLQKTIYGEIASQQLSMTTLGFTFVATASISAIAGVCAAVRACRLNVAESLRGSGS